MLNAKFVLLALSGKVNVIVPSSIPHEGETLAIVASGNL